MAVCLLLRTLNILRGNSHQAPTLCQVLPERMLWGWHPLLKQAHHCPACIVSSHHVQQTPDIEGNRSLQRNKNDQIQASVDCRLLLFKLFSPVSKFNSKWLALGGSPMILFPFVSFMLSSCYYLKEYSMAWEPLIILEANFQKERECYNEVIK